MGTYNASADEISTKLDDLEFEAEIEGDFYFDDFVLGAIAYIELLKKRGMSCPIRNRGSIKKIKEILEDS